MEDRCPECHHGVVLINGNEIQRCDSCRQLETDDQAVEVVQALLEGRSLGGPPFLADPEPAPEGAGVPEA